ncbi:ANTAR domain-containing protein [Mycolicibacterium obuense]|uniref:ANTAR domain protein n=1 Tax=Mycolicibacterium obuense TaxID=1807 RepID=A0A0J6VHU5_9MYCO|nr:ANTAR domain-containing protein [Mycolicibacterium obuense]KMO69023.1 ANTAR domain protein [Mycolicibacterium obuense]OKH76137.1 hypothetical protein EB72_06175 [Mycobacterium sp. SWH-M1]
MTSTTADGRRTLCAAQGALAVVLHCSIDDAFAYIVRTAQRHNVAPLRLAEALLAVAAGGPSTCTDLDAAAAVDMTWGDMLRTARWQLPLS